MTISEVFMICDAYENGIGQGLEGSQYLNPYDSISKLHEAYKIGFDLGVERTARAKKLASLVTIIPENVSRERDEA